MQDFPLTIDRDLAARRPGARRQRVRHLDRERPAPGDLRRGRRPAPTGSRARCARLGIEPGDRVGTFMWNSQEHLEAYFAIPSMGAVLHTLNIRLFPEQLTYVINHAEDKRHHRRRLARAGARQGRRRADDRRALHRRRRRRRVGARATDAAILRYDELLAAEPPEFEWPEVDERQAAAMCYTSRHDRQPEGRRRTRTARRSCTRSRRPRRPRSASSERDRILTIVPMFHANAWGIPYAAFMCGASLVMPGRFLQAEPLTRDDQGGARHVLGRGAHDLGRHPAATAKSTRSTSRRSA